LKKLSALLVCATFGVCLRAAQLPVPLASAGNFTILAGASVTSTGPTVIMGNLGVSPQTAISGFPPASVIAGAIHDNDAVAAQAEMDLTAAYINASTRPTPIVIAGNLGGLTLTPGLYQSASTIGITGILTLNGQGNANSVFIFQIGSGLTTLSGSQIVLQGGAQAANIFWQVGSSATLGTTSIFEGTIMAQASITLATGASLNGRALARIGSVTLDSNTVVNPGPATTGPPGALSVACPSGTAQIGVVYNSFLTATGGTPPYTFSITGALPSGLTLNTSTGVVSGVVAGLAATPFTIRVVDSLAGTATNTCSIASIAPLPLATTPAPSSLLLVLIGLACTLLYRFAKA
jgi:Ice-binding-like/Putative Ig domain